MIVLVDKKNLSQHEQEIQEIFFLTTSKKDFTSEQQKMDFYHLWTKFYFENKNSQVLVKKCPQTQQPLGYLMGAMKSQEALPHFIEHNPSFELFFDLYEDFPAHLHINVHPEAHSKGLGTELIQYYTEYLKEKNISGVHLITSPQSRNVSFYTKNGFEHSYLRAHQGREYLFLGQLL